MQLNIFVFSSVYLTGGASKHFQKHLAVLRSQSSRITFFTHLRTAICDSVNRCNRRIDPVVPGRTSSVTDVFIDFSGGILGVLVVLGIYALTTRLVRKKHTSNRQNQLLQKVLKAEEN